MLPLRILRFAVLSAIVAGLHPASANEGLVKPYRETTLSAQVLGLIAEIPVKDGDRIEAGDVLLRMDDRVEQLEVQRRNLVREDRSELELARRRAEILTEEASATRELYENNRSISREEMNRKEIEASMAAAERQKLENREQLERIEWQMASEQLSRRHLRAPFGGIVVNVLIEEGEVCQPGQPLVEMVDISKCYLECYLDGAAGLELSEGQSVALLVPAGAELVSTTGVVEHIAPIVDAASGLRKVRVLFENPNGTITPGLPGRIVGPAASTSVQ